MRRLGPPQHVNTTGLSGNFSWHRRREETKSIRRFAAFVDKLYGLPVQGEEGQCAYHPELQVGYRFLLEIASGLQNTESDKVISDLVRSFKRERPIPVKHVVEWEVH